MRMKVNTYDIAEISKRYLLCAKDTGMWEGYVTKAKFLRGKAEDDLLGGSGRHYQSHKAPHLLGFVQCHGLSVTRSKAAAGRQNGR
jgi:hypothetical protein